MKSFKNIAILFSILVVVGFFHNRYELKLKRETEVDTNTAIQNYLLDDVTLGKVKNHYYGYMFHTSIIQDNG